MIAKSDYGEWKLRLGISSPHLSSSSIGSDKQPRMRNAHILVITIKALSNEVSKNLVLAGIGSLTVLDPGIVTEEDLGAQFFISGESVGLNVCCFLSKVSGDGLMTGVEGGSSSAGATAIEPACSG